MFKHLKEMVFDKNPDAKVLIYTGGRHGAEKPYKDYDKKEKQKALGFFLEEYTKGKSYSVLLRPKLEGYSNYWGVDSSFFDLDLTEHILYKPK